MKRALIYSESLQHVHNEHLRSIYISTYGIIFFSTPHLGIDSDNWNAFVSSNDTNTHQSADLLPLSSAANSLNWTNETLHNVNRLFADKMGRFRIFFFHETTATKSENGTEYFIDEVSAAPSISGVERAGIEGGHNAIPKFEDANSPGFEIVEEAIIRFCGTAINVIKNRWIDETSGRISRRKREANELEGMYSVFSVVQCCLRCFILTSVGSLERNPKPSQVQTGESSLPWYENLSPDFSYDSRALEHTDCRPRSAIYS